MGRDTVYCIRRGDRGSMLFILALISPLVLCALGLDVDNAHMFRAKRLLQSAADAAVVAAARELRKDKVDRFVAAAREDAELNGATDESGAVVTVNHPPKKGRWAGDNDFVEVIVERDVPTFFMRAFGRSAVEIEARAVAGLIDRNIGVYAIDPGDPRTLTVAKDGNVQVPECEVFVNSESRSAAVTDGSGRLSTTRMEVVGDYDGDGFFPDPEVGAPQIADPLEDLATPTYAGCDHYDTVTVRGKTRLRPGVYCGGIDVVDDGEATFASGVYVLRGGGLRVGKRCQLVEEEKEDHHGDSDSDSDSDARCNGDSDVDSDCHANGDGEKEHKVTIGHEESQDAHTIEVDLHALPAHFAHGDTGGACSDLCVVDDDGGHGDDDSDGYSSGDSDSDCHCDGDSDADSDCSAGAKCCSPADVGSGVTCYVTDGPDCAYGAIDIDRHARVDLTAPTSGALSGVLFFQDRDIASGPGSKLPVGSGNRISGVAYFATTDVQLQGGHAAASQKMKIVADKIAFEGALTVDCSSTTGPLTPTALKTVALSE